MSFPWKALVRDLRDEHSRRPYLDDVRRRVGGVEEEQERLEREIVREMAQALGRAAEKVTAALARLDRAARDLEAAAGGPERQAEVARFNAARREALRLRHELLIHREAIGIRRNDALETLYPIPPARRA